MNKNVSLFNQIFIIVNKTEDRKTQTCLTSAVLDTRVSARERHVLLVKVADGVRALAAAALT